MQIYGEIGQLWLGGGLYHKNIDKVDKTTFIETGDYKRGEFNKFGSKPFNEWVAYNEMIMVEDQNSTVDWDLSPSVVKELRL